MAEKIGEGYIEIEIRDEGVEGDLARIDAQFQREMEKIRRTKAEAKIGADLKELDRDLKEAEAKLKRFNQRRADATLTKGQRDYATRQAKALDEAIKKGKQLVDQKKKELEASKANTKELQLQNRETAARERAERAAYTARQRAANARAKTDAQAAKEAERTAKAAEREAAAHQKALDNVGRMKQRYSELAQQVQKIERQRRSVKGDALATQVLQLKEGNIEEDMRRIRRHLQSLGHDITIPVELTPAKDAGGRFRAAFEGGRGRAGIAGGVLAAAHQLGVESGDAMERGLRERFSGGRIRQTFARPFQAALGTFGKLGNASIRLGPFTTSIRGAVAALGLLGPALVDVVGAIGAFGAVLGSAATGVGALGAGLIGGFIPAAVGAFAVLKPLVSQFQSAQKASKAYNDAIAKGNTDLAKKKLKELNSVLGNVDKDTRNAFINAGKLGQEWNKATAPARQKAFHTIGEALATANALMPDMAKNTNVLFGALDEGISKWAQGLRSTGGRDLFSDLFSGFNQMVSPLLSGLGNVAAYLGKVGESANRMIGLPVANTFKAWADRLNESQQRGGQLDDKMNNLYTSMKSVGHLTAATGRLTKAFFSQGVEGGRNLTDSLTGVLNRWTAFAQTPAGGRQINQCFDESVAGAKSLVSALAPVVSGFVAFSRALAPSARVFFDFAGAIGSFATDLLKISVLRGPVTALAATLGTLFALKRVGNWVNSFTSFTNGVRVAAAGNAGVAASSEAAAAGLNAEAAAATRAGAALERMAVAQRVSTTSATLGGLGNLGAGGGLGRTAGNLGKVEQASGRLGGTLGKVGRGLGGVVTGLTGLSPLAAGVAVGVGALAYGMIKTANATENYEKTRAAANKADQQSAVYMQTATVGMAGLAQQTLTAKSATQGYASARKQSAAEEKQMATLRKAGKKDTQEYRDIEQQHKQTILDVRGALLNQITARREQQKQLKDERKAIADSVSTKQKEVDLAKREVQQLGDSRQGLTGIYKGVAAAAKAAGVSVADYIKNSDRPIRYGDQLLKYDAALKHLQQTQREFGQTSQQANLQSLNLSRAMQGLAPMAQRAAAAFATVKKLGGTKLQTQIATKFESPKDASRVAASAAKSLQSGVPAKITTRIVADSKNADQAVKRLQNARLTTKKLNIIEQGGSKAVHTLEQIAGRKLTPKEMAIIPQENGALRVLAKIMGVKIPPKTSKVSAQDQASAIIAGIIAKIAGVQSKSVTITTTYVERRTGIKGQGLRAASGRPAGVSNKSVLVGEGNDFGGARELLANRRTGRIASVDRPTITDLDKDTYVIPADENPKQRRELLRSFFQDMGIPRYAKGYEPPKPIEQLKSVKEYAKLKDQEDDKNKEISLAQSRVKEPDSFLTQVGTDAAGNPTYAINQSAVNAFYAQLRVVQDRMKELMDILTAMSTKIVTVIADLNTYAAARRDAIAKFNGTGKYKGHGIIEMDEKLVRSSKKAKKGSRAEKLTKQREDKLDRDKNRRDLEQQRLGDATKAVYDNQREQTDLGYRTTSAKYDQADLQDEINAISPNAQKQLSDTIKDAPAPGAFDDLNAVTESLDAQQALTDIGQGSLSSDAIFNARRTNYQSIIDRGKAMLADADPTNDSTANQAISGAASALGSLGGSSPSSGAGTAFNTGLRSLQQSYGSNSLAAAAIMGGPSSARGSGSYGTNPSAPGFAPGNNVQVNNYFTQPPQDPHSWSAGVNFELGAMMG